MSGHIKVCCRIRGPAPIDKCLSISEIGETGGCDVLVSLGRDHTGESQAQAYDVDHAYDESCSQEQVRPLLRSR